MTPTLRAARLGDWPGIRKLLEARNLPVDGARAHLLEFLVATSDGSNDVIGVAGLERYGDVGLLRSVAVADDETARGIGAALTRAVLDRARNEGLRMLYLLTTTAATWFPRFGFTVVSRDELPAALNASAELRGACPSTAVAMQLLLD
jgi:amino-acid N-acetyltransferase